MKGYIKTFMLLFCLFMTSYLWAQRIDRSNPDIQQFINKMSKHPGFSKPALEELFKHVHYRANVLKKMRKPLESMSWCAYKRYFLDAKRIKLGTVYWHRNKLIFNQVKKRYGVSPKIILAIIGIESFYGTYHGGKSKLSPAIDALSTLAFYYTRRKKFFQNELTDYLILCKKYDFNPLKLKSSYAGALGQAQFMPSSYLQYAVDYSHDGHIDLFNNSADVIASIANYLKSHGWKEGAPIASQKLIPKHSFTIKKFKGSCGPKRWYLYNNFIAITKYNPSYFYAMAVYQLSLKLKRPHSNIWTES